MATLSTQRQILKDLEDLWIEVISTDVKNVLANLMVQSILIERIKMAQQNDIHLC